MLSLTPKKINILIFIVLLIWWIGILWEIVAAKYPSLFYYLPFLKYNYSIVCHAQPEKLFQIGDFHTLVCSRCFGIYTGAIVSILLIILGLIKSAGTKFLLISVIPMILDIVLYSVGIYNYSQWIAFLTGLLLGSIGFSYIHASLLKILIKNKGVN